MAATAHADTKQTTQQTVTGTTWVTKVTIASSNFVANAKYLILCFAQLDGDTDGDEYDFRLADGAGTVLSNSTSINEFLVAASEVNSTYGYFHVWTHPATAQDLNFQMRVSVGGGTGLADSISMVAIRLDADLTENTDWFSNEDTSGASHTTTMVDRASITFTPGNNGDDWLVIACWNIGPRTSSINYEVQTLLDGTAFNFVSEEYEDATEARVGCLARVVNLDNTSHTIKIQSRDDLSGATQSIHNRSIIFALNMAKFEDHGFFWNETEIDPADSGAGFTEVGNVDITPQTAGDILIIATAVSDASSSTDGIDARIQLGGSDVPTSSGSNQWAESWDGTDENPFGMATMENVAASAQDVDFDAGEATTSGLRVEDRSLIVFSMESAAGGGGGGGIAVLRRRREED